MEKNQSQVLKGLEQINDITDKILKEKVPIDDF